MPLRKLLEVALIKKFITSQIPLLIQNLVTLNTSIKDLEVLQQQATSIHQIAGKSNHLLYLTELPVIKKYLMYINIGIAIIAACMTILTVALVSYLLKG